MKKPRLTSEERRQQILKNASKVFAEHGLSGARTKEIAKACNINEAVLYTHFESKDELFRESFHFMQKDLLDELQEIAKQAPDGFTALRETVRRQITGLVLNPDLRAHLFHSFASMAQDRDMFEWVKGWCTDQHGFIHDLIERGISDGSIKPDTYVDCAAWHLKGVMWACILAAMLEMEGRGVEAMSLNLIDKVVNDLKSE